MKRLFKITWPELRNILLCLPLGIAGMLLVCRAVYVPFFTYPELAERFPERAEFLATRGIHQLIGTGAVAHAIVGFWLLLAFALGLLRRRRQTLNFVRSACIAAYVLGGFAVFAAWRGVGLIYEFDVDLDKVTVFNWFVDLIDVYSLLIVVAGFVHLHCWRRGQLNLYCGEAMDGPAPGDRALEAIRTHGHDPQYRKSVYGSVFLHILVIVIIPWLLFLFGCVEDYRVPKGSGNPAVMQVMVVQKKEEKKKPMILNPKSAIIFKQPDITDSELLKDVVKTTDRQYVATSTAQPGALGVGGGDEGGWPDGMEDAVVRFIRMQYNGSDWDDGMDVRSGADRNFLERFHKITGFDVRKHGEAHRISLLRKYRPGFAPPFVYMTGNGSIHVGNREIEVLRDYLTDGGMLFADCGGPAWDDSFRSFAKKLFPGKALLRISDDDPIFQLPYVLPGGAPPLWHHGGNNALGIKYKGRWVVFYHPGDLNDAWKTGHSGVSKDKADLAFQMGINIVYYAFTNYLELTREHRK